MLMTQDDMALIGSVRACADAEKRLKRKYYNISQCCSASPFTPADAPPFAASRLPSGHAAIISELKAPQDNPRPVVSVRVNCFGKTHHPDQQEAFKADPNCNLLDMFNAAAEPAMGSPSSLSSGGVAYPDCLVDHLQLPHPPQEPTSRLILANQQLSREQHCQSPAQHDYSCLFSAGIAAIGDPATAQALLHASEAADFEGILWGRIVPILSGIQSTAARPPTPHQLVSTISDASFAAAAADAQAPSNGIGSPVSSQPDHPSDSGTCLLDPPLFVGGQRRQMMDPRAAISSAIKTLLANMKERNGAQDADMNIRPVVASILLALQAKSMPDSSPCVSNMDPEEARRFARSAWVLTWLPELVFVSMEALSQQTQAEGCTAFTLDSSLLTRLLASKGGLRALASPRVLDLIFQRQTNDSEKQQLERQAQSQPALQVAPLVNRAQPARMQQNHLAAALNQSTCFGFNEHQQLTKNECTPDDAPQASSHGQIVLSEMRWQRALCKLDAMDFHSQKAQSSPSLFLHQQPGDQWYPSDHHHHHHQETDIADAYTTPQRLMAPATGSPAWRMRDRRGHHQDYSSAGLYHRAASPAQGFLQPQNLSSTLKLEQFPEAEWQKHGLDGSFGQRGMETSMDIKPEAKRRRRASHPGSECADLQLQQQVKEQIHFDKEKLLDQKYHQEKKAKANKKKGTAKATGRPRVSSQPKKKKPVRKQEMPIPEEKAPTPREEVLSPEKEAHGSHWEDEPFREQRFESSMAIAASPDAAHDETPFAWPCMYKVSRADSYTDCAAWTLAYTCLACFACDVPHKQAGSLSPVTSILLPFACTSCIPFQAITMWRCLLCTVAG